METKNKLESRRKYDADFKKVALKMIGSGRKAPDMAQPLGIATNLIYQWKWTRTDVSISDISSVNFF